ncbi:MAG: DUF4097 domain-containing protein [Clostridiales bacterium]|nr:DUF4097 domain-containing protein [Clostridiales bacterium]
MERNEHFDSGSLADVVVHLAWAQLEIFADDVDKIQVLVSGDDQSVNDLRILATDGILLVEQPQYGLSLNIVDGHWMQVCIRMPRSWQKPIHINTISGLLSARGLHGRSILLDTVSGDLRAVRIKAQELKLKTVSGDVRAEDLHADTLSVRSISGDIVLDILQVDTLRCNSVSGEQTYHMSAAFKRVDINTVSGAVVITSPLERMNVSLRSLSGRVRTEGVSLSDDASAPAVRITGISADLKLISIKE